MAYSTFRLGWKTEITAAELNAALESLGLADGDFEDLAIDLGITPPILREWASGATPIPRDVESDLVDYLDALRDKQALEESGLPACEWARQTDAQGEALAENDNWTELLGFLAAGWKHRRKCAVCRARREFLAALAKQRERFDNRLRHAPPQRHGNNNPS